MNSIDIKSAFLQSEEFDREVYLKPPSEANCDENILWKLNKCVYGLNDAARKWYITMKTFLLKFGCSQVKTDPAAFYWYQDGELSGIFLMHVDDFSMAGTDDFLDQLEREKYYFTAVEVERKDDGIEIVMEDYAESLEEI